MKRKRGTSIEDSKAYFDTLKTKEHYGHDGKVQSVGWSCTGLKLASASVDKNGRIWNFDKDGALISELSLKGHTESVERIKFHPKNPDVVASCSLDKTLRIWDVRSGKCTHSVDTKGQNINLAWSPDGQYLAVGNKKDIVSIIDTAKYKILKNHRFTSEIDEMSWNSTGDTVLLTTGSGSIKLMSFPSFEHKLSLQAHTSSAYCLQFDPLGRYLATGGADSLVQLYDLREMACVRTFDRLESPIRALGFSADGNFIASGSEDLKIDISDVESGEHVYTVDSRAQLLSLAWNPKKNIFAFTTEDTYNGRGVVSIFGVPKESKDK